MEYIYKISAHLTALHDLHANTEKIYKKTEEIKHEKDRQNCSYYCGCCRSDRIISSFTDDDESSQTVAASTDIMISYVDTELGVID